MDFTFDKKNFYERGDIAIKPLGNSKRYRLKAKDGCTLKAPPHEITTITLWKL